MFNSYYDIIKYISKSGDKDEMGYTKDIEVEKHVRYVGGTEVQIQTGNGYRTEHRLVYHSPFEVKDGEHFIIDNNKLEVKKSERVVDVTGKTIYWILELN